MKPISSLLLDNAVAAKDAILFVRHRGGVAALAAILAIATVTAALVMLTIHGSIEQAAYRDHLFAHGRTLTAAVTIVALAVAALLVPAMASTSIASERESGTLRLLMTTALTPGDIVVGKLIALLHAAAPSLLVLFPMLAGGTLVGAVSWLNVLGCVVLVVANVVALASVSLAVSAHSDSLRTAVPRGIAAAILLVVPPVSLPSAIIVGMWAAMGYRPAMVPGAVSVAAWTVVVTIGSLLLAREALAPPGPSTGRARGVLAAVALLVGPALAALSARSLSAHADVEVWSSLFLFAWGGLFLVVVLVDVSLADRDRGGVWRAASRSAWCACLGLVLAAPLAAASLDRGGGSWDAAHAALGAAGAVALWLAGAALVTAALAGRVQTPSRRVIGAVLLLSAVVCTPPLVQEIPLVGAVLPFVDPFSLIHVVTEAVVSPFDTPWSRYNADAVGSLGEIFVALAALLTMVTALALRERFRARR